MQSAAIFVSLLWTVFGQMSTEQSSFEVFLFGNVVKTKLVKEYFIKAVAKCRLSPSEPYETNCLNVTRVQFYFNHLLFKFGH